MRTLIREATLVSAGSLGRIVEDGYLRIVDGQITEAGKGHASPKSGETVIEGRGLVVFPGLINTHMHLFQSLLKRDTPSQSSQNAREPSLLRRAPPKGER